jgi:PAS domain S-box-containing protein
MLLCLFFASPLQRAAAKDRFDSVKLQLKWRHQFQFAGYYAAIQQGYYRDEGLEVELIEPGVGEDSLDVLLEGAADFAVSTSDVVKQVAQGAPLVALAVIYQHSPQMLVSLQGRGIETLHDLAGKTLIMETNSADLLAMLKAEGIDLESIEILPHDFSVDSLVDGKGAALSAYMTDEPFVLREMGLDPIIFSPRAAGIDFYGDTLTTTRQMLENHPDIVERFRRASLKGWEYAFANEEAVIDLILSEYSQRKTREQLQYEAAKTRILVQPDLVEIGYMNPGRWRRISEVFAEVGLTERAVDPEDFVYRVERPFPWKAIILSIVLPVGFALMVALFAYRSHRSMQRLKQEMERRATAERKLQESERVFRSLYETAPLAFLFWDRDLRILRWNPAAERMFGWKSEEVVGKPFMDLIVPEDERSRVSENNDDVLNAGLTTFSNWNLRKDGSRIWCEWHNVKRVDAQGNFLEGQSIAIDTTEKHLKQEAMKSDVRQAIEDKENKSRFIATVCHELRNPLAAIIGFASLIHESSEDADRQEMAGHIAESGDSMLRILNDLIEHEQVEAGKLAIIPAPMKPHDVIGKMVKLYTPVAREKGIHLEFVVNGDKVEAQLDALRVEQIVTNLLSNAIKYSDEGTVTVVYEFRQGDARPIHLEIRDKGVGMSEEEVANIFQFYQRGNSAKNQRFSGSGVGLAVTRQLTELMGGTISVKSRKADGTTFYVDLPLSVNT